MPTVYSPMFLDCLSRIGTGWSAHTTWICPHAWSNRGARSIEIYRRHIHIPNRHNQMCADCVSGICHPISQSFSMLRESNDVRDCLWCKVQGRHSCQPSRFLRDSPEFNSMSRLPDPASFCPGFKECPIKMNDSMFCSYFCSCNQKQRSVKPFDSQRFECGMIIGYLCMVINQQVPSWSGLKPINTTEHCLLSISNIRPNLKGLADRSRSRTYAVPNQLCAEPTGSNRDCATVSKLRGLRSHQRIGF